MKIIVPKYGVKLIWCYFNLVYILKVKVVLIVECDDS